MRDEEEYTTLTKTFSQVPLLSRVEPGGYLAKATILWNDIAILDDLEEYKQASHLLMIAQTEYYLAAFKKYPSSYEAKNKCGRTILAFAAGKGHADIVKLLLNTIHPDITDRRYGETPLLFAVKNRHEAVVKILLATGQVDANQKDRWGHTPLSWAAEDGDEAIVKLLLATGQVDAELENDFYY